MKKITFFLTTLFFIGSFDSSALADTYKYSPYLGIDYAYNHTTARGFSPYYNIAGAHIGSDYSKYFSTELFVNRSNLNKRHPLNVKTYYISYGLDLMAYLPVNCRKTFYLLATSGIGEYIYTTKFVPLKSHKEHGYGYRFGGGIKYDIDEHWQTKLIARYVNFDKVSGYDHDNEYSVALEYHF
ncbi:MAG: porin family protein [Alphaproteobacteria bacterium]|nr:porin family protein [Alphaproteobacteria bacterium]